MRKIIYREYNLGYLLQRVNKRFKQEDKPFSLVSKTAFQVSTVIQSFVVEWQMHKIDLKKSQEKTVKEINPIFYLQ